jgi:hypothetical protein
VGKHAGIESAMLGLGYVPFPFEAYDSAGRLVGATDVDMPSHVRDGIGEIVNAPVWKDIYRTLAVLDDKQWACYMVGTGFHSGTLNVAIFKGANSLPNPAAADRWIQSYNGTVATTLASYVGTQHSVAPRWLDILDQAIEAAKNVGRSEVGPRQTRSSEIEPPADAPEYIESGVADILLDGLTFISKLFRGLDVTTQLRTTVFWYAVKGQEFNRPFAVAWTPLHREYSEEIGIRTVHSLWNPAPQQGFGGDKPHFWQGVEVDWMSKRAPMPHALWRWCSSFYPTGACRPSSPTSRYDWVGTA